MAGRLRFAMCFANDIVVEIEDADQSTVSRPSPMMNAL
jgi:hypothetical protein